MTKTNFFEHNGTTYVREVDMLGDVQRVQWFTYEQKEIYDNDLMVELEDAYENTIMASIFPIITYI